MVLWAFGRPATGAKRSVPPRFNVERSNRIRRPRSNTALKVYSSTLRAQFLAVLVTTRAATFTGRSGTCSFTNSGVSTSQRGLFTTRSVHASSHACSAAFLRSFGSVTLRRPAPRDRVVQAAHGVTGGYPPMYNATHITLRQSRKLRPRGEPMRARRGITPSPQLLRRPVFTRRTGL